MVVTASVLDVEMISVLDVEMRGRLRTTARPGSP
ncbi:hypothetical protein K701_00695 [Streptomyces fradiae ATCC 10745 = DSM 40063]|uniref:Uncharacterized protein n=1 Tax=Streptomyces fradiae ATCC 10745 = DSM 40063 TaxID=1319510 RepID=A0ABQ6Y2L6_STRFR|nr:hypothetical protein K701_00695 [Streptomyces fradiae ATCC 10745 = DSM 40063]